MPLLPLLGRRFDSKNVKIFQSAFDRFRHFDFETGHLPRRTHRQVH
jgi:hypothetical protein